MYNEVLKPLNKNTDKTKFTYSSLLSYGFPNFLYTGDLPQRICTRAELKFYLSNFIASKSSTTVTFLQPNRNCNRSSWISGCEPGWSCNTGSVRPVDFRETSEIPDRTSHCQPCCEGFFCPHGLTCMIRKSFHIITFGA